MPALIIERKGAVATLINNDPPRNRMTLAFMDELEEEIARLGADPSVRALVITGSGNEHFSVGMDLKQLPQGIQQKGSIEAVFDQRLRVLAAIEHLEKPVIALMYGYCLGEGSSCPWPATSGLPPRKERRSAFPRWTSAPSQLGAAPHASRDAWAETMPSI